MAELKATIYHNPACGTSRRTLALLKERGIEPAVVEYLETPPDRDTLAKMIADAGLSVRDALRQRGSPYEELGLGDPKWTDDQLLDLMVKDPALINRPFVVTGKGTRLARPPETVEEIL